jgi:co-chaperonin GroES (HSP10)
MPSAKPAGKPFIVQIHRRCREHPSIARPGRRQARARRAQIPRGNRHPRHRERPTFGKVIAVGQGKVLENGQTRAPDVKVGDRVLFGKYSGTEVKVDNEEIVVMREDDVMAVVER